MQSQVPRRGGAPGLGERGATRQRVFHVLRENPCPYLPDRSERKLMTVIEGKGATGFYSLLSQAGFRRSHIFAYRPACSGCAACVPVRVLASRFRASRNLRRLIVRNADILGSDRPALATPEQFAVFRRYIRSRHGGGEMADMGLDDYRSMIEDSHLETRVIEYRLPDGRMVAACLADWLEDGASAVYSFYDPALARRSLGTWMVLDLIRRTEARGLPHVYLGYWVAQSRKMAYKARFRPLEGLTEAGWQQLAP